MTPPKGQPITAIPRLGSGTFAIPSSNGSNVIASALQNGYRHIDAAAIYGNEVTIGKGIAEGLNRTGLRREDIWVTTKLWADRAGDQAPKGLDESLQRLGLSYVDLFLIHFPVDTTEGGRAKFNHVATWKAMEKLVGPKVRYIGVSNFSPKQMEEVLAAASVRPKIHQFELHPYLQQTEFLDWHKKNNITVTGYAPLGNTSPYYAQPGRRFPPILRNPVIQEISKARGCTEAQTVLAWNMKRGVAVIPKASQVVHQKDNITAYDKCKLTDEDMAKIAGMSTQWAGRMNNPCRNFNPRMPCYEGLQDPSSGR